MIADALKFFEKAPVGMARSKDVGQIAVVAGAVIFVGENKGYGCARGDTFKDAGKDVYRVGFSARGGGGAVTGFPAVKFYLHVGRIEGNARRTAVHDTAQARAVGFAKGGQPQDAAKGISSHDNLA